MSGRNSTPLPSSRMRSRCSAVSPSPSGGIWDAWKEPDGGWLQSFAIITTDPNELTATVHNRMPVIVRPSDYDRWLTRDDPERPPVDLLRPYDAGEMKGFPRSEEHTSELQSLR